MAELELTAETVFIASGGVVDAVPVWRGEAVLTAQGAVIEHRVQMTAQAFLTAQGTVGPSVALTAQATLSGQLTGGPSVLFTAGGTFTNTGGEVRKAGSVAFTAEGNLVAEGSQSEPALAILSAAAQVLGGGHLVKAGQATWSAAAAQSAALSRRRAAILTGSVDLSPAGALVKTGQAAWTAGAAFTGDSTGGDQRSIYQDVTGLTTGAPYTCTVWVYVEAGHASLVLADGGGWSNAERIDTTELGWQQLQLTTHAAVTGVRVALVRGEASVVTFDAAMLNAGASPYPFRVPPADADGAAYAYRVTRNLDGTGANAWAEGDAVFNTGQAGNGFIDLYSLAGVQAMVPDFIYNYDNNGASSPFEAGNYSQNYAQSAYWTLFGDGAGTGINDAIYIGVANKADWTNLYFNLTTAAVWNLTHTIEIWNNVAWVPLFTLTAGDAFTTAGARNWEWTDLTGTWVQKTINGHSAYWVRLRITAFTSVTTLPQQGGRRVYRRKRNFGPTVVMNVRNSTTYNDWTEHSAIGNLAGLYDYAGDVYGVGLGKYASGQPWIGIDSTNGLRIMRGVAPATQLARWDILGNILVGRQEASQSNVYITAGGVQLRNNTIVKVDLQSDGDVFVGRDVSAAATTSMAVFTNVQTYNSESMAASDILFGDNTAAKGNVKITGGNLYVRAGTVRKVELQSDGDVFIGRDVSAAATTALAIFNNSQTYNGEAGVFAAGDILIGDNSASKANVFWDQSAGRLNFRGGTTTQVYIDTDGTLSAGGSNIKLNSGGMTLLGSGSAFASTASIRFINGANDIGRIFATTNSGDVEVRMQANQLTGGAATATIYGGSGLAGFSSSIEVKGGSAGAIRYSSINHNFEGGVNLGSASSIANQAPSNSFYLNGDISARWETTGAMLGVHPTYGTTYASFWKSGASYSVLTEGTHTYIAAPSASGQIYFRQGNSQVFATFNTAGHLVLNNVIYPGFTNATADLAQTSYYIAGQTNAPAGLRLFGNITLNHNIYPGSDNGVGGTAQGSYYIQGSSSAPAGLFTNGSWLVGVNIYLGNQTTYGIAYTATPYSVALPGLYVLASGSFSATNFLSDAYFRTVGNGGWISQTWGGGWFMQDATYVRAYGNKNVYTAGFVRADTGFVAPGSGGAADFAMDITAAPQAITIANAATATPFGNANNFAGFFIVQNLTNGAISSWLTGGSAMARQTDPANVFTNVQGTGSKTNIYLTAGNVVTIENRTGVSVTYHVMAFRIRNTS